MFGQFRHRDLTIRSETTILSFHFSLSAATIWQTAEILYCANWQQEQKIIGYIQY